jgi:hypothetical protein
MKPYVQNTFAAVGAVVAFTAYLWAGATTVRDPVDWQDGDLIVQDARVEPILPVFSADGSGLTHIGIVARDGDAVTVIEAAETVTEIPLAVFVERSRQKRFSAWRVTGLTPEQQAGIVATARAHLGKPNDFFLGQGTEALYSSELVRMAFAGFGEPLGRTQKLGRIGDAPAAVMSKFNSKWQEVPACKRRYLDQRQCWDLVSRYNVVTPSAIVADPRVTRIYDSLTPAVAEGATPAVAPSAAAPPAAASGPALRALGSEG